MLQVARTSAFSQVLRLHAATRRLLRSDSIGTMTRREWLLLAGGGLTSLGLPRALDALASATAQTDPPRADITLRIGEIDLELAPKHSVRTIAYNGQVPGPMLRARAGRPVVVEVWNDTKDEELVHWHGFQIPPEVDGAHEEGTPHVPARGHQRYTFTPNPAGTRWYHSHGMAGRGLKKTTYTGQFGMFLVESGDDPGDYDQEVPILLHEWEPRFIEEGPLDIRFRSQTVNGKMLGAGEPIRVRPSQRVLFRILNASATLHHQLALPGHLFHVLALDGYPVPRPRAVPMLSLGPGERIDAIVEMNRPGVWVLGEVDTGHRTAGMGVVVEYAGERGTPRWLPVPAFEWEYATFGGSEPVAAPDDHLKLVFKAVGDGHQWTINGKSFPKTDPILVQPHKRYRWTFDNQSADAHPVHLHRHNFELVSVAGTSMSGIVKDVVVVPAWKEVEVDVRTTEPGPALFHCHQQFHMDMGFMTVMRYTG